MGITNLDHISNTIALRDLALNDARSLVLIVDESKISDLELCINFFMPEYRVVKLPGSTSPSHFNVPSSRIPALLDLVKTSDRRIVLTSMNALAKKLPPVDFIINNSITVKKGEFFERDALINSLIDLGYARFVNAAHSGEIAVRGSIIDIVSESDNNAYRVDFDGSKIDSIKIFDPITQISTGVVSHFTLFPSKEIPLDNQSIKNFKEVFRQRFGLSYENIVENLENKSLVPGVESLYPLFHVKLSPFFDYISKDDFIFVFYGNERPVYEGATHKNSLSLIYEGDVYRNWEAVKNTNVDFKSMPQLDFEDFYYSENDFFELMSEFDCIDVFEKTLGIANNSKMHASILNEASLQKKSSFSILKDKISQIESHGSDTERYVICCSSKKSLDALSELLTKYDINTVHIQDFNDLLSVNKRKYPKQSIVLVVFPLEINFSHRSIIFLKESDFIDNRNRESSNKRRRINSLLFSDLAAFSAGDIVVHIEHGIGCFEGLESICISNIAHDFIKIGYADNDKFYLPVENLDSLTKYGSFETTVKLDKLGAASWQSRKAKLKNRIKVAAENLLKTAAIRNAAKTMPIIPDKDSYLSFVSSFPYVETDDQCNAIDDVMSDLASGKPMDRLLCGDVGFGKTEVALRAAFAVASSVDKYQIAILVPTTLLSRQHTKTFSGRFADWPINIKELSKFTKHSEIKLIKEGINNGDVDIVIGTHALLAKDINFNNLGLIIIDEEQHFGVAQKERLKELKALTHVLTLSATPIPRTLQLSIMGIRDLSIIATPPINRLPVETFVMEVNYSVIKEAIIREISRDGRVFYITPRIAYIDEIVNKLKEILPNAKVIAAHGGMSAPELDSIMNDFFDGKYNVLVSTTIIESGLDIPDANTIIIDRAHFFGLSQLYQIRGRVGRSNKQAFAYITYPRRLKLNKVAEQRLSVMRSIDSLGAGFTIASHDMDIRGHGNILGDEQSGYVKEVGIELYQHMLEEAINALRSDSEADGYADWSPAINLGIAVQIPEEYVPDVSLRINLYRRIANVVSEEEIKDLVVEMEDRFGLLPISVHNLVRVVIIKRKAKIANIEKLDIGEFGVVISFKDERATYPDKVLDFINKNFIHAKLKGSKKLIVSLKCLDGINILCKAENLVDSLCAA